MADNMGGISDAWFAFSRQIASVSQEADKVKVGLKSGDWINLHPGRYGTSIKVEPQESESGTLYNVSGSLQIPRQYMTNDLWQKCERLNTSRRSLSTNTLAGIHSWSDRIVFP